MANDDHFPTARMLFQMGVIMAAWQDFIAEHPDYKESEHYACCEKTRWLFSSLQEYERLTKGMVEEFDRRLGITKK